MEISLKNKVIVITGGTKGLGKAVAENACKTGAKIIISGRDNDSGREIVRRMEEDSNGEATFIAGDLKQIENCKNLIQAAIDKYGKLDGLVNYAGITSTSNLLETTEKLFDDIFNINFKTAFFCSKFAVKEMLKNGGSIVHIGSTHAHGGDIIRAAYGCSKGALAVLSKHIAKNYGKYNIRSNVIVMGWTATPSEIDKYKQWGYNLDELNQKGKESIPMGRLQVMEDYVPAVLYLLSDSSCHLTDSELKINGGFWPKYG